jgi:TDG/mug DNA glycosylase family protein
MTIHAKGFPPIAGKQARVLVLGSLPGRQSILMQQYYAHPQNAFWRIMDALLDVDAAKPYQHRTRLLREAGVAVWDVLDSSVRPGSLDADIVESTAVSNDIVEFLKQHTQVRAILFNGQAAARLFRKRVGPTLDELGRELDLHTLPSTSPAHAALSVDEKARRWALMKSYL